MFTKRKTIPFQVLTALIITTILAAFAPQSAFAAETSNKPYIEILGVKANESVTVQAQRFPANETFNIRVGSFTNFFKDYVVVGTIDSGQGGSFKFTVQLPSTVKGVEMVTIRLDSSQKHYAYNAFKNVNSGTVIPVTGPTPIPTPVSGNCQISSTSPTGWVSTRDDFDVIWTVKNTSTTTWELNTVDYKFISGTQLYKYGNMYDLMQTVKPGESVKIVVDAVAPNQSGTYAMNWAIVNGSTTLCTLPATIYVK